MECYFILGDLNLAWLFRGEFVHVCVGMRVIDSMNEWIINTTTLLVWLTPRSVYVMVVNKAVGQHQYKPTSLHPNIIHYHLIFEKSNVKFAIFFFFFLFVNKIKAPDFISYRDAWILFISFLMHIFLSQMSTHDVTEQQNNIWWKQLIDGAWCLNIWGSTIAIEKEHHGYRESE